MTAAADESAVVLVAQWDYSSTVGTEFFEKLGYTVRKSLSGAKIFGDGLFNLRADLW